MLMDGWRLQAINLYNQPGTTTGIDELHAWLGAFNNCHVATIIGMDSNLHHHSLNPPGYNHVHKTAKSLVATCGKNGFRLISNKKSPTFLSSRGSKTTIDLTWANFLAAKLISNTTISANIQGSNHQKLVTTISLAPPGPVYWTVAPKATKIDQDVLRADVKNNLAQLSDHLTQLSIDEAKMCLTSSIFGAWQAQGKKTLVNYCRTQNWWEKKVLDPLVNTRNKCRRLLVMDPTPENAEKFNYWNGCFRETVTRLKKQHWRTFLASTNSTSVFQAFQFTKTRSGGSILPLRGPTGDITSNKEEQAALLFEGTSVVTSKCNLADVPPTKDAEFVTYPPVTREEVRGVLGRMAKQKATGPDHIPNEIFTLCADKVTDTLTTFFNRCIVEGHFPASWRSAITAIIQTFNKPDYTSPGVYRPIALLSTLSKVFETIIANHLTFWAESRKVLPEGHEGGRQGKGCEDAMVALTMWVKRKWREGKMVTALFLDVKSAYPSVHPRRLVHSLQHKGCPTYLWKLIAHFMDSRTTQLRLANYLSAEFQIAQGLPQGSPLSVILYILYNSDLLIPTFDFGSNKVSLGFIDEVVHLTMDKQMTTAMQKLTHLGEKPLA
jgi:hypothetical protein